jgi:hypothetical protein
MVNNVRPMPLTLRLRRRINPGLLSYFTLALLLFVSFRAQAQSCALCYTQAASSGSRMMQALRSGILLLIVPPTLMSVGVVFVAYAKRNQFRRIDSVDPEPDLDEPRDDANRDSPRGPCPFPEICKD